jgi:hypothetical protein
MLTDKRGDEVSQYRREKKRPDGGREETHGEEGAKRAWAEPGKKVSTENQEGG